MIYKVGDWVEAQRYVPDQLEGGGLYRITRITQPDPGHQLIFELSGKPATSYPSTYFRKVDRNTLKELKFEENDVVKCVEPQGSILQNDTPYVVALNILSPSGDVLCKVRHQQGNTEMPGEWAQWRFA